jgi:hypothetical protein
VPGNVPRVVIPLDGGPLVGCSGPNQNASPVTSSPRVLGTTTFTHVRSLDTREATNDVPRGGSYLSTESWELQGSPAVIILFTMKLMIDSRRHFCPSLFAVALLVCRMVYREV